MVALAEWIAPNFSIDGFWTYIGVVFIVWIVNWAGYPLIDPFERDRPDQPRDLADLGESSPASSSPAATTMGSTWRAGGSR